MGHMIKTGIDLLDIKGFEKSASNRFFVDKVFHPSETKDLTKLASIFAIKEACIKALEISSNNWLEIEVKYKKSGKPIISLGKGITPKDLISIDCSLSHDANLIIANVILLLEHKQ